MEEKQLWRRGSSPPLDLGGFGLASVVYGRKVLTSNLPRRLAGLTWILQHELGEQWGEPG